MYSNVPKNKGKLKFNWKKIDYNNDTSTALHLPCSWLEGYARPLSFAIYVCGSASLT